MIIPDEFMDLAGCFYPMYEDEKIVSEEQFIKRSLLCLSPNARLVLKNFLDEALATGFPVSELQRAWMAGGPRYGYNDRDLLTFLGMVRDALR